MDIKDRIGFHVNDELLSRYLDDELDSEERERVESHLAQDAESRKQLEALRHTLDILHRMKPIEAPSDFSKKMQRRARRFRQYRKSSDSGLVNYWSYGTMAAIVIAIALLLLLVYQTLPLLGVQENAKKPEERVRIEKLLDKAPRKRAALKKTFEKQASPKKNSETSHP